MRSRMLFPFTFVLLFPLACSGPTGLDAAFRGVHEATEPITRSSLELLADLLVERGGEALRAFCAEQGKINDVIRSFAEVLVERYGVEVVTPILQQASMSDEPCVATIAQRLLDEVLAVERTDP